MSQQQTQQGRGKRAFQCIMFASHGGVGLVLKLPGQEVPVLRRELLGLLDHAGPALCGWGQDDLWTSGAAVGSQLGALYCHFQLAPPWVRR